MRPVPNDVNLLSTLSYLIEPIFSHIEMLSLCSEHGVKNPELVSLISEAINLEKLYIRELTSILEDKSHPYWLSYSNSDYELSDGSRIVNDPNSIAHTLNLDRLHDIYDNEGYSDYLE